MSTADRRWRRRNARNARKIDGTAKREEERKY
jgi:hypothetical protein